MPKPGRRARPEHVLQVLVVLPGTDPLVWRRIQVPESYSFWDLHVAIQDAMGWRDCHLHEFVLHARSTGRLERIGIPGEETPDEAPCLPGWKVAIVLFLDYGSDPVRYRYDFGDDWQHTLEFEAVLPHDGGVYPRCLAGAGACPPEDVGGIPGYADFLEVVRNRRHPEHRTTMEWVGGRFDPDRFDPAAVAFDDPRERWERAFSEDD